MTTVISGTSGIDNLAASSVLQADLASNVVGNGPAFSVYASAIQGLTTGVSAKVNLNAEEFDTNNNFDTTNYRFTPTVAGYYQFYGSVYVTTAAITEAVIYKNGSLYKWGSLAYVSAQAVSTINAIIYLNGTTDYVELWVQATGTNPATGAGASVTFLQGCLVRASNIVNDGGIPVTNPGVYVAEPLTGFKNYLINGGCQVAQRGNVAAVKDVYTYGGADRICVAINGTTASGTIQRYYAPTGTVSNYAQGVAATTTGTGSVQFQQRIEAVNTLALNGKNVTVSATVYQNTGSAQPVTIVIGKPTTTSDTFSAQTALSSSNSFSIPTGVPTPISWTYTLGAAEATLGLVVSIVFTNVGAVTAKDFWIGDFQLEKGTVPTRFDTRPYHVELAACLRYYETSGFNYTGYTITGAGYGQKQVFLVQKRAVPTITLSGVSGTNVTTMTLTGYIDGVANNGYATTTGVVNWGGIYYASAEL